MLLVQREIRRELRNLGAGSAGDALRLRILRMTLKCTFPANLATLH